MPVWSLKRRILLINIGALGVVLTLFGVYFINTQQTFLSSMLIARGVSSTEQLAMLGARSIAGRPTEDSLQELAVIILEQRSVRAVQIHDSLNNKQYRAGPSMLQVMSERADLHDRNVVVSETDASYRFVRAMTSTDNAGQKADYGWVEIEYANHPLIIRMFQTLLTSGLIILGMLIAMIALSVLLTSKYSRKVQKILESVDSAASNSASTEIALDGDDDELEKLASKLNTMWLNVYANQKETERSAAQTTRDLRETLETLEVQNIELDLARKEAVNASHVKSEFLANTSHEIRTPLNGIIGFTNLLTKTPLTDKQADYVNTIRQSANGLLRIINDILDFSKLEAGKLVLDYIPINLLDLLEETLTLLAPMANDRNISLSIVYQHNVPEQITGDPQRLQQIMTNLVHNAIKFTTDGEVKIAVQLLDNRELEISVTDTGIGMSEEQQRSLFNAFSQGDSSVSRNYGGTGLGLVIAQRLVEQMDSRISLQSEANVGSTFRFSLQTKVITQDVPMTNFENLTVCYFIQHNGFMQSLQQLFRRWRIGSQRINTLAAVPDAAPGGETMNGVEVMLLAVDNSCLDDADTVAHIIRIAGQYKTVVMCAGEVQNRLQSLLGSTRFETVFTPLRRSTLHDTLCAAIAEPGQLSTAETDAPASTKLRSSRVLIVDDNQANLKLLRLMLENEGLSCNAVDNAQSAIEACDTEVFQLIFMDIQMPEISGLEATQKIRMHSILNRATPVIAVTAHAQTEDKNAFMRAGMNDYLGKPIMEEQLSQVLNHWTQRGLTMGEEQQSLEQEVVDTTAPVDLQLCLTSTGKKPELAKDMLRGLLDSLPEERLRIANLKQQKNLDAFSMAVHRLHGNACYTGVPVLRQICHSIEDDVKSGHSEQAFARADQLDAEISRLIAWHEQHDLDVLFE
ncbi:MAG: response regulator [Pseudomonadales bacterium]